MSGKYTYLTDPQVGRLVNILGPFFAGEEQDVLIRGYDLMLSYVQDRVGALPPSLVSMGNVVTSANNILYTTGPGTFSNTALSPFMREALSKVDADTIRTYIGASGLISSTDDITEGATNKYYTDTRVDLRGLANNWIVNPMTAVGDIIVGGASGSPTSLPAGTNGQVLKIVAGVPDWENEAGAGGGVADGDKGDVVVSGTGSIWTIDSGVVSTSKLGGDITAAGKALLDDADAATQRTTLGLGTAATSNVGAFATAVHSHILANVTDVTMTAANLNTLDDGVNSTLHFHDADRARANHTGTQSLDTTTDSASRLAMTSAERTKLTGIATGATANATDASLRDRATHTGTQTASTISDFNTSADARVTAAIGSTVQAFDGDLAAIAALAGTSGLARKTAANTWSLDTSTYLTGNQAITLSGDLSGSGSTSIAATIANDAVTNAKLANAPANTLKGNNTGSAADPLDLTIAQVKTLLSYTPADIGAATSAHTHLLAAGATDVTITAANLNTLDDGVSTSLHFHSTDRDRANHTGSQLAATISDFSTAADARIGLASINALADVVITAASTGQVLKYNGTNWINDTDATGGGGVSDGDKGDITVSGGGVTWTVDSDTITNSKLSNVATATIKGRVTAGSGDPEDLTGTQATALLDVFSSTLKGLSPASGGGTTNFLRADGTWAVPAGGGGSTDLGKVLAAVTFTSTF